jgi:hypothetical protein
MFMTFFRWEGAHCAYLLTHNCGLWPKRDLELPPSPYSEGVIASVDLSFKF